MNEEGQWMLPGDREILTYLRTRGDDRAPFIANRLGLHLGYVEERCGVLADRGLVETAEDGTVFRLTEHGQRFVEDVTEGGADGRGQHGRDG